jgi:hypothetical protein
MPISKKTLDAWFSTAPLSDAQKAARAEVTEMHDRLTMSLGDGSNTKDEINGGCRAFIELIDRVAPNGDDKTDAIRLVRLACKAFNDALHHSKIRETGNPRWDPQMLLDRAFHDLHSARYFAVSAIAAGPGK